MNSSEPVPETAAHLCHLPQNPNVGHLRDAPELADWRWGGCEKLPDQETEPQTSQKHKRGVSTELWAVDPPCSQTGI